MIRRIVILTALVVLASLMIAYGQGCFTPVHNCGAFRCSLTDGGVR